MPKALVLCGGKGTRIQSVSKGYPKCLMEVAGKPFIFYILDNLKALGILEVILCTGYKSEELKIKYQNIIKIENFIFKRSTTSWYSEVL